MDKRKNKILIISVSSLVAVTALIGLIIFIIIANKTSINLNNYITISYEGYDGHGEVNYDINYKKLIEDYSEKLDLNNESARITFEFVLEECISGEFNKDNGLSNGESISFKWSVNDEVFEDKYGCTLEYENFKKNVSGLEELMVYDPFEKLNVTFDGMSPLGKVTIDSSDIDYIWLQYTASPSSGLKNGDTVRVNVKYDETYEQYCIQNGIRLANLEKEYRVEGLSSYVTDISDISEEQLTKMKNQAGDAFKAYVATKWSEKESMKAMNYLGCYLLNAKGSVGYGEANNYLYLIYKIDVSNSQGDLSYYYYTRFDTLYITGDGEFVVDIMNYTVPTGGYLQYVNKGVYGEAFMHGTYYYMGYKTIDELFNACVTANLEKYSYTSNVVE